MNLNVALETGIEGGSISIFNGSEQIASWIGNREISKAEDLLENISGLLAKHQLRQNRIAVIAVSNDIGSATGLKIGLATAKGLARAFNSRLLEISLYDSIISDIGLINSKNSFNNMLALPFGKNSIYRRIITHENPSEVFTADKIVKSETFFQKLDGYTGRVYTHHKILDVVDRNKESQNIEFIKLNSNLAYILGKRAFDNLNNQINASDNG